MTYATDVSRERFPVPTAEHTVEENRQMCEMVRMATAEAGHPVHFVGHDETGYAFCKSAELPPYDVRCKATILAYNTLGWDYEWAN